jgi:hypothetical protein
LRATPRPEPEVLARLFKCPLGLPAKLLVCTRGIRSQIQHIAWTSRGDLVWKLTTHSSGKSVDHLENSAAFTSAQIPGTDARTVLAQVVKGFEVAGGEVKDMYVVTNSGAITGRIIYNGIRY